MRTCERYGSVITVYPLQISSMSSLIHYQKQQWNNTLYSRMFIFLSFLRTLRTWQLDEISRHCRYPEDLKEDEDYFFDPRFGESWIFRKPIFFPHDPRGTVTELSTSNSLNPEDILPPPDLPPSLPLLSSVKDNIKSQSLDENGERYECLLCTKPKRKRAKSGFSLIGIKSHLKLKWAGFSTIFILIWCWVELLSA